MWSLLNEFETRSFHLYLPAISHIDGILNPQAVNGSHQNKIQTNQTHLGNSNLLVLAKRLRELVPCGCKFLAVAAPRGVKLDEKPALGNSGLEVVVFQNHETVFLLLCWRSRCLSLEGLGER